MGQLPRLILPVVISLSSQGQAFQNLEHSLESLTSIVESELIYWCTHRRAWLHNITPGHTIERSTETGIPPAVIPFLSRGVTCENIFSPPSSASPPFRLSIPHEEPSTRTTLEPREGSRLAEGSCLSEGQHVILAPLATYEFCRMPHRTR